MSVSLFTHLPPPAPQMFAEPVGVDQGVTAAAAGCCGRNVDPPLLRISFPPSALGRLEGKPVPYTVLAALSCSSFLQGTCYEITTRNTAEVLMFQACACDLGRMC